MKRYVTGGWRGLIEEREITRETDKMVFFMESRGTRGQVESRSMKDSGREKWHETWEAAHAYLMERAEQNVLAARRALQQAQDKLGNVKGMKKPQEAA